MIRWLLRRAEGVVQSRHRGMLALALGAALLGSCDEPAGTGDSVDRIEVTPSPLILNAGEVRQLSGRVVSPSGSVVTGRRVFWASQNTTIATVTQAGLVTAVSPGNTQIAVSTGGASALVAVTVAPRPVSSVRVTPSTTTLPVDATSLLTAEALDATGTPVTGRPTLWTTSDETIATVSSTGVVSGVSPGTVSVTASVDGVSGVAVVTVTPVPVATVTVSPGTQNVVAGGTVQLSATTASATGATLNGRIVTWSSNSVSTASVSSTGLVTAFAAGSATITATSEGRSGTARITVTPVAVDTIFISPSAQTMSAGSSIQFNAQPRDANGNLLVRSIIWASDQPGVATVSPNGLVTAISTGAARISASADGKVATATVSVTPLAIASLTITPPATSLVIGATTQLTAIARDAQGNVLAGRVTTWIAGAPLVATVSQTGLVTAVGAGSAIIFAASEGQVGQANILVNTIGVASVVVALPSGANGTVQQGQALQLSATVRDAGGNVITGRPVAWASSHETIATVSSTGRVVAISPGFAAVSATVDGVSGGTTITVSPVPVASMTVAPTTVTLSIGAMQQLTPSLFDAGGNPLSLLGRSISYSSSNPAAATVSSTGLVSAVAAGTSTITITCEGVTRTSTITVSPVSVASVVIAPDPASIEEGGAIQLTATTLDAGGGVLTGRPITWSSNNAAVAVSSTGRVTTFVNTSAGQNAIITASSPNSGSGGSTPSTTSAVSVTYAPVATVILTPQSATILPGGAPTPVAAELRSSGNIALQQSGRTLTWVSSNPAVATVNPTTGAISGVAVGGPINVVATASSPGQTGVLPADTVRVTVSSVPVASVTVAPLSGPNPGSVHQGTLYRRTYLATPRDAGNNVLANRSVVWSVTDNTKAQITQQGDTTVVTGVAVTPAPITLTATAEGVAGTIPLTIDLVPVSAIIVTKNPNVDSIFVAQTRAHTASPRDSANTVIGSSAALGNPLGGRTTAWRSDSTQFATVSTAGLATAVAAGNTKIVATIGGTSDSSATLRVILPVTSVALALAADSLILPGTIAGTVTVSNGATPLAGRVVSFASTDVSLATVAPASGITNASGQVAVTVTGVRPGLPIIAATSAAVSDSAKPRILARLDSILLIPATDSLIGNAGATLVLTARAVDSTGAALPGRLLSAVSATTGVATVAPASAVTNGTGDVALTVTLAASGSTQLTVSSATLKTHVRTLRMLDPVSSVAVPPTATIAVGVTSDLTATVTTAAGPALGRACTAVSSAPAVATVVPATGNTSATGTLLYSITGVATGSSIVTVTCEGIANSTTVTVP